METMMGAVRQRSLDVSHEERDACLHALGALHASGKLTLSELDARIQAALAARTGAELAALVRESSRIEVAPARPTAEEPPAAVAPRFQRTAGWIFALRLTGFVALALLGVLVRVLASAAVALCVGLGRALVIAAWVGWVGYHALVRGLRTWGASLGRTTERPAPTRLQLRRPASQELVLIPRAQVPAQRVPLKVHPVIVPSETEPAPTTSVTASRSTEMVRIRQAVLRGQVVSRDLAVDGQAVGREDRRVRVLVSQLRPLVHRVTERARWRRMTTHACERAARTKGWRRTISASRTAF